MKTSTQDMKPDTHAGPHEHAEISQHNVVWTQLKSEGILKRIPTMNPAEQFTNP